jgi:ParB/RepB/Spo0J family partition protein
MWDMHDRLGEDIDIRSCASLIDSFRKHGQKHPVLGRVAAGSNDFEFELVYGARRLFAAQHLGMDLLVDVRAFDDRAALVEMDVENRVRTDISPYERGRSYRRWLGAGYFKNQAEIARALAVSEAQISRLLRYAELPAAVVDAFESPNEIREEWAVCLAKLCSDAGTRSIVTNRARSWRNAGRSASAQTVFDALVNGRGKDAPATCRSRDDVIKDPGGKPLFRVGFRAKTVHFIVPRSRMTVDVLQHVNKELTNVLRNTSGGEASSRAEVLANRSLRLTAHSSGAAQGAKSAQNVVPSLRANEEAINVGGGV